MFTLFRLNGSPENLAKSAKSEVSLKIQHHVAAEAMTRDVLLRTM